MCAKPFQACAIEEHQLVGCIMLVVVTISFPLGSKPSHSLGHENNQRSYKQHTK